MKENKKVTLEQGSSDEFRRITLEQGEEFDKESTTPQWNSMIDNTKETAAHYTTIFATSFFGSIVPTFFFVLGLLVLVFLKLCC